MQKTILYASKLSKKSFAQFGQVIETEGSSSFWINEKKCKRFDALADIDVTRSSGHPVISIFKSRPYSIPIKLRIFERHPLGSQAIFPIKSDQFLITIAEDKNGVPYNPKAFLTNGKQGVNIYKNIWHGVLTPIGRQSEFLVVDRSDPDTNLELFELTTPIEVFLPKGSTLIPPQDRDEKC